MFEFSQSDYYRYMRTNVRIKILFAPSRIVDITLRPLIDLTFEASRSKPAEKGCDMNDRRNNARGRDIKRRLRKPLQKS